jgi:ribosomal protein L12E/L44/L45/RPP1/RPP2
MKRIKLNIEIEVDGKDADKLVKNLEKLSDAITGKTKKTIAKVSVLKTSPKKVKAPKKADKPKKAKKSTQKVEGGNAKFIATWNASSGTKEVAEQLGLTVPEVRRHASLLKLDGVQLKKFKPGRRPKN